MMDENIVENRRVETKTPVARWGIWLLIPLTVSFVVLFIFAVEWRDTLKIQRVVVEGSTLIPAQEIVNLAKVGTKSLMYQLDLAEVQDGIMGHPYIQEVTVSRQFPDVLVVDVEERQPIASLSGHRMWYVDRRGVLLPYANLTAKLDLPVISGLDVLDKATPGRPLMSDELTSALEILWMIQSMDTIIYHYISEVNMNHGGEIILYSTDTGIPIYFGRGDVPKKLVMLKGFLQSFVKTTETRTLRAIDLRFEDQVVVKWKQQRDGSAGKALL